MMGLITKQPRAEVVAFGLLASVQFVLIAAITVLSVALPSIQRDLGLTTADLALSSAAYGLSFSGLLVFGGRLTDLLGHRRILVIGLAIFCVASASVGLASGLWMLLAARFTQGIGAALAAPAAMALLGSVFSDARRRQRKIAIWGTVASIGATAGTLMSGVVVDLASWRWAFVPLVVVAATALLATFYVIPAGPPPLRTRVDVLGAVLVTLGLSTLSYGLVTSMDHPWSSLTTLRWLLAGVALLLLFVLVESRSSEPLVPLPLFASGRRVTALCAVLLGSATMSTIFFFLALYFQQVRGFSPLLTSVAFIPFSVVLLVTGSVSGRVVEQFGASITTAAGLALAALGLVSLSQLGVNTPYFGVMLIGLLLFPVGAGLTFSGATVSAVWGAPDQEAGLISGVVNTALEVGPTVGLAVLVSLAGAHTVAVQATGVDTARATTAGYGFALSIAGITAATLCLVTLITLRHRVKLAVHFSSTSAEK
jgi:MFS family permease